MPYLIRWAWAEARWLAKTLGYWIRPYDMLADARRWRWQPRQRCGWSYARGGVVRGRSDPGDDRILAKLSDGHAWMPAAAVDLFGEDLIRRMTGVDHVNRVGAEVGHEEDEVQF